MRSRLVGLFLVVGLLGGGAGAFAATKGLPVNAFSNGKGSANAQYCPPTSQNPGALKGPGVNCGNPKTKKHSNVKSKSCRKHRKARKSADAFVDKRKHHKSCTRSRHHKSKGHGKGKKK